mgnify:CR=1 FL=1
MVLLGEFDNFTDAIQVCNSIGARFKWTFPGVSENDKGKYELSIDSENKALIERMKNYVRGAQRAIKERN